MKQQFAPRKARALAPLLVATALVSTPVFAQDTTPQTAPAQPAIVTPPATATVPIPPVARTVPDGTPPAASTADEPAATPAPRATTATRSTTRTTRTVTHTRTASAARSTPAPAPEAAPAPAPQAAAPAPAPVAPPADTAASAPAPAPAAAPATEPAAPAADGASTQSTTITTDVPIWAWVAGGVALLAVIIGAVLAMRGRRREDEYEPIYVEETYVEPQTEPVAVAPVIEPVPVAKAEPRKEPEYLRRSAPVGAAAAEPVVAAPDAVAMSTPPAADVAQLTAGTAPVAERPWLEFAMRPVRAGTNIEEALVEIELTVGNAGSAPARNVRISTFLLSSDPTGSEMERLLVNPPADGTTDPVTINPGEGKRIDATLALLKSDMGENLPDAIRPIIVADARYTLEDGSEGRTSASFVVGVTPEEGGSGLEPLELSRASMHENVGAELRGEPQHA
jgi:hypothetical protein